MITLRSLPHILVDQEKLYTTAFCVKLILDVYRYNFSDLHSAYVLQPAVSHSVM